MQLTVARLTVLIVLSAVWCGCRAGEREQVLDRYMSGPKKTVAVYSGSGSDETLIERRTYSRSGHLIVVEDVQGGTTKNYIDLNDAYDGLLDYLEDGSWSRSAHVPSDVEGERAYLEESFRVVGNTLEYVFRRQDPEAGPDTLLVARNRFGVAARTSNTFRVDTWLSHEGDFLVQDRSQALEALRESSGHGVCSRYRPGARP